MAELPTWSTRAAIYLLHEAYVPGEEFQEAKIVKKKKAKLPFGGAIDLDSKLVTQLGSNKKSE